MSTTELAPQLVRQLKRAGILDEGELPPAEAWRKFLRAVNEHYRQAESDREVLARSSDVAANMVSEAQQRLHAQKEVLRTTLSTVAGAIDTFSRIAGAEDPTEVESIEAAKAETSRQIEKLFGENLVAQDSSGELSGVKANLVRLADELVRLLAEMSEKAKLKRELEAARVLQQILLPSEEPIDQPFVRVAGAFRSMAECGGDFWASYDLTEGRTLVLVGDVTGHGIPAAIVTGAARAASATAVALTKGNVGAGEILAMMNGAIHQSVQRHVMMTCTAAVIDPRASTVTFANAGHHFSYLVRAALARPLVAHGPPLGAAPTAQYEEVTSVLQPADTLVWFTDGLIEAENEWGEQFTEKRLRALCQRVASDGAVAARDGILEVLSQFRGKHPPSDDVTVVVATIK